MIRVSDIYFQPDGRNLPIRPAQGRTGEGPTVATYIRGLDCSANNTDAQQHSNMVTLDVVTFMDKYPIIQFLE